MIIRLIMKYLIIQFLSNFFIKEVPIPTYYGDENIFMKKD